MTNEHTRVSELLPLYVSRALDPAQRAAVEKHLPGCPECQADLALWKAMAAEIVTAGQAAAAPKGLADRALASLGHPPVPQTLARPEPRPWRRLERIFQLLCAQMPLVNREIWPASALVIGLGYVIALISDQTGVIYALAPLIAATCVSLIYGSESDPAYELALSTPTSPRQILLARLVLVFGYNLALVLIATLGLLPIQSAQPVLGSLLLAWLAPMTFLSAMALVLSLWIGPQNAITISYIAWIAQLFIGPLRKVLAMPAINGASLTPFTAGFMALYQNFWQTPALLLALSILLFAAAAWLAGKQEFRTVQSA
jgi:hypothetical protein